VERGPIEVQPIDVEPIEGGAIDVEPIEGGAIDVEPIERYPIQAQTQHSCHQPPTRTSRSTCE
jgi:hypothetical protein